MHRVLRRRAFAMIGLLLGARLAFGLMAETGPGWIADARAFALGFALSALGAGARKLAAHARANTRLSLLPCARHSLH